MSKRRISGFAVGVASALAAVAFAPAAAQAHPCATDAWVLSTSTFLSSNNSNIAWGGSLPTMNNDSDCAPVEVDLAGPKSVAVTGADASADPVGPEVERFTYSSNMTPLGYSARVIPGTGLADINSDMAFKGNYAFQGHWSGFRVIDISDPTNPTQVYNTEACRHTSGQGDVVVHGNILVRTWDAPATGTQAGATCGGEPVGTGFEGIHIWDITDPTNPVFKKQLRMAGSGNDPGAPAVGCGAHTATGVPDDARGHLYLYVGGSSGTCTGMDIVRISQANPADAVYLRRAAASRQCHDNNVILGDVNMAMCAGGNGFSVFKFDPNRPADEAGTPEAPGGIANPTLLYSRNNSAETAHSGSFTYDGKLLMFGHEPGGGTAARCGPQSGNTNTPHQRTLFFHDAATGAPVGTLVRDGTPGKPRLQQNANENCTWHNFNVVPTYKGYFAVVGSYQAGISVIDFTDPTDAKEIAFADPAPIVPNATGGDWSSHFYNGKIYQSDIRRGFLIWDLDHDSMRRVRTPDMSNPQTQTASFAQDLDAPTVTSTNEGQGYKQGSTVAADFACTDSDSGVESCTASVTNLDTSSIGNKSFTVTATDKAGNSSTTTVNYMVNSTDVQSGAGGSVAATLSLTLGAPASFGAFVPGVAGSYTASTTANVISTAGDASLSVADNGPNPGHLVNGAFALPQPLQGLGVVKTYDGPVSNDTATVTFTQAIAAGDALRTGSYSKTLTFTLSTTNP